MRAASLLPLLLVVASMSACGSGTEPGLPDGDVSIVLNASTKGATAFSPNPFTRSQATSAAVTWVNADRTTSGYGTSGVTHRLVSDTGVFDSGSMAPGSTYSFTFAAPGTYAYHCSVHPTMIGTITILP